MDVMLDGYIAVTVFEFDDYVNISGSSHLPHRMDERANPCYHEEVKWLGKKEFFKDEDRMKLFAHKLQTYAMELLEEEE